MINQNLGTMNQVGDNIEVFSTKDQTNQGVGILNCITSKHNDPYTKEL